MIIAFNLLIVIIAVLCRIFIINKVNKDIDLEDAQLPENKQAKNGKLIGSSIAILLAIILLSFLSPYKYTWDESITQIDYDKLDVLIFCWGTFTAIISAMLIITVPKVKKQLFYVSYAVFLGYSAYKLISYMIIK